MILPKIVDALTRLSNAGVDPDSNRYDRSFTEDQVHKGRASVLIQYYAKTKKINPIWTQQFIAKYEPNLQDETCVVRFQVPPVLTLNTFIDGFLYVGTIDGNCQYRKLNTRAALANSNANHYTQPRPGEVKFIYSDGYIECYGNDELQDLRVDGIFLNPTDIPIYNKKLDQYPLDEALILEMQNLIFNTEIKPEIYQPAKVKEQQESK